MKKYTVTVKTHGGHWFTSQFEFLDHATKAYESVDPRGQIMAVEITERQPDGQEFVMVTKTESSTGDNHETYGSKYDRIYSTTKRVTKARRRRRNPPTTKSGRVDLPFWHPYWTTGRY